MSAGSRMTSFHEIRVEGHIEAMFVHVFYYFGGHDVLFSKVFLHMLTFEFWFDGNRPTAILVKYAV